jgi:hypothetical protein
MADHQPILGNEDRQLINVNQEHDVRYWSHRFGITLAQLREAVQAVGPNARAVGTYVHQRSGRSHWRERSVG